MLKLYLKTIIISGMLVFCSGYLYSQVTLTIPTDPLDPSCTTIARDYIYIVPVPGGSTIIQPTSSCPIQTIKLDENIICPTYYQTEIDPDTRPFNTTDLPVGTTNGAYSVNEQTGAANYTIPISIPPGTMGMEPSIAISYNSQSGNALLGYGWNLSGLSAITRVGQDLYNDGKVTGVNFSGEDKFALDGNRLVDYSGFYGAVNSTYFTENANFSKVSLLTANGENYFMVETKDGKIIRYGYYDPNNDSKSRMDLGGSASHTLAWLVTDITDKMGNYVRFYYNNDNSKNEFWIERIGYTGNTNTDSKPYNFINFYYETRTDINNVYIAGYKLQNDVILRMIKTFSENNLVKTYNFKYTKDANNLYSILNEIKETGSDGSTFNSIAVGQGVTGPANFQISTYGAVAGQKEDISSGDYNNDGYSDILATSYETTVATSQAASFKYNSRFQLYLNKKDGTYDQTSTPVSLPLTYSTYYGPRGTGGSDGNIPENFFTLSNNDFNGDGKDDILTSESYISTGLFHYRQIDKFKIYLSQSNSFSTPLVYFPSTYNVVNAKGEFLCTGDFDGDGASDFITVLSDGGTFKPFMYSPKHWTQLGGVSPYIIQYADGTDILPSTTIDKFIPVDFNGDGKDELMIVSGSTVRIFSFSNPSDLGPNGSGYGSIIIATLLYPISPNSSATELTNQYETIPGDFNGDGKTDFLTCSHYGSWAIAYSTGTNFEIVPFNYLSGTGFIGYYHPGIKVKVGDYNGDGKSDILIEHDQVGATPLIMELYLSNGIGFVKKNITSNINLNANNSESTPLISGDFNGDGKTDEINYYNNPNFAIFHFDKNGQELLTTKIADGLNFKTNINYKLLTDNSNPSEPFYTKVPNDGDVICIQKPVNVVSSVSTSNGLGGVFTTSYKYEGLKVHTKGLGLLGFSKFTQSNLNNSIILQYTYNNMLSLATPYCNIYLSKKITTTSGSTPVTVSTETYTNGQETFYAGGKRLFTYTKALEIQNSVTGLHTITNYSYELNSYVPAGNLSSSITKYMYGSTEIARKIESYSGYTHAGSWLDSYGPGEQWCNNKYTNKTITDVRYNPSGTSTISRSYTYSWDANTGFLNSVTDDLGVTTTYTPDPDFGVVTQVQVTASDIVDPRTTTYDYDSKKRFITTKTILNPVSNINIVNKTQYDSKFGNVIWSKDENGLITTNTYDGFGKIKETTLPTGKKIKTTINWANVATDPANSLYYTKSESGGNPWVMEYKDVLGRTVREKTIGFKTAGTGSGPCTTQEIYNDNIYNTKGQLVEKHFLDPAGTDVKTIYSYNDPDGYDRLMSITPDSPLPTITYAYTTPTTGGISVTETNVTPNQSKTTTTDPTGLVSSVVDIGGTISYTYNGLGQPLTINNSNGSPTTITYDNFGRQMSLTDPNAGTTSYTYYKNGELHTQTDAEGNVYTMTYDALGRVATKSCPTDGTYNHFYDTETKGVGKIASITGPNSMSQSYKYDALGRNYQFTEAISGTNFTTNYAFDDYGNITKITYPDPSGSGNRYSVTNVYDDNLGVLKEVKQTSDNTSIWKLDVMDYMQHISQYHTANNSIITNKSFDPISGNLNHIQTGSIFDYTFSFDPKTGNLTTRSGNNINTPALSETFTYDILNRLKTSTTGLTTNYFDNGNIKNKSDVSTSYYQYDPSHPNAVGTITNSVGNISSLKQITDYNAFNKISQITEDATTNKLIFTYGVDQQRKMMQTYINNNLTATKYYTTGFEREIAGSNTTDWNYIAGGDGLAAIYRIVNGTGTLYWVAKDHLGSIMGLYDQSGNIVIDNGNLQEYSYDAWGRRRNPTNWSYSITLPTLISRGYTGHEHLDQFGIINMNGRLYDPILGRMFSPDNFVQDATGTQTFNRYSYCNNNPLKYTDPTGDFFWMPVIIGAIMGGYSGWQIGKAHGATGLSMAGYIGCGAFIGGITSYAGSAISTSLGAAWQGAYGGLYANMTGAAVSGGLNNIGMSALAGQGITAKSLIGSGISGIAGSFVGMKTGGIGGSILGGATAGGVGAAFNGGNNNDIINAAITGGAMSGASYSLQSYVGWQTSDRRFSFGQYLAANKAMQLSFSHNREYGFWLTKDGSGKSGVDWWKPGSVGKSQIFPSEIPDNVEITGSFHTHYNIGGGYGALTTYGNFEGDITNNFLSSFHEPIMYVGARDYSFINYYPSTFFGLFNSNFLGYPYYLHYFGFHY